MESTNTFSFLRYPGGKQRLLNNFIPLLPSVSEIVNYVEPFLGGGAVFFHVQPNRAVLADINQELIQLYLGVKHHPTKIWKAFSTFPATKSGYYEVRDMPLNSLDIPTREARILYLNRTCFKGMWRHNASGRFNVGYGGEDRRGVISKSDLMEVSRRLKKARVICRDFEEVIGSCKAGDFVFVDPPYCPGEREMFHAHYTYGKFDFEQQKRLAVVLHAATKKNVRWLMTNSNHNDIISLYTDHRCVPFFKGTGGLPPIK
jgi:DNA adenine methylase